MESNLGHLRTTAGISKTQLASASGLSVATINRVEKGRIPRPTTLYKVYNGYNKIADVKLKDINEMFPDFEPPPAAA